MDYSMLLENDAIVMNDFESFEGPDAIQAPPERVASLPLTCFEGDDDVGALKKVMMEHSGQGRIRLTPQGNGNDEMMGVRYHLDVTEASKLPILIDSLVKSRCSRRQY